MLSMIAQSHQTPTLRPGQLHHILGVQEGVEAAVDDGVEVSVRLGGVGAVEGGDFADERAGHRH